MESELTERDAQGTREQGAEGRHLEGSGHTCHIPFISSSAYLKQPHSFFWERCRANKTNRTRIWRGDGEGETEEWSWGAEGLSDLFALLISCQGDVIWPNPTMKVISQSKGINSKLQQRPGTSGPLALFICELWQTDSPILNSNGLCFLPVNLWACNHWQFPLQSPKTRD